MNAKTTKPTKNAPSEKLLLPLQLFAFPGPATTRLKNLTNCLQPRIYQALTARNNVSNGNKQLQNVFGKYQNGFKSNPDCLAAQRALQLRRINPFSQKSIEGLQENQNCGFAGLLRGPVGKQKISFARPKFELKRKNSQLILSKTRQDSELEYSETGEYSTFQRNIKSKPTIGGALFSKISCSLFPVSKSLRKKNDLLPTCDSFSDVAKNPFSRKLSNLISSKSSITETETQLIFSPEIPPLENYDSISYFSICLKNALGYLKETQNCYGVPTCSVFRKPVFSNRKPNFTVDFITKVVDRMELKERVLFFAIDLFYFACKIISLVNVDPTLLGLATVFIAAKFEDAWAPHSNKFFKLDSVREVKDKLIELETQILFALNFKLNLVLVYDFYCTFSFLAGLPKRAHCLGLYLLNSCLAIDSFQQVDKYTLAFVICKVVIQYLDLPFFWNNYFGENKKMVGLKIDDQLFRVFQEFGKSQKVKYDFSFEKESVDEMNTELMSTLRSILTKNSDTFVVRYQRDDFAGVSKLRLI